MKIKFPLIDLCDLEDDIAELTDSVEPKYTDEREGWYCYVYQPRYVFPKLGVAFYIADLICAEDDEPARDVALMYKQDERDLNKYEDVGPSNIYSLLAEHFKGYKGKDEECYIDLDEFLTTEQQIKLKNENPELEIWNYLEE